MFVLVQSVAFAADDPLTSYYVIPEQPTMKTGFSGPVDVVVLGLTEGPAVNLLNLVLQSRPFPAPSVPYNRRTHFGNWVNDRRDPDCYNTRAKVLMRDSKRPVTFNPRNRCTVAGGEWLEPYAGRRVFVATELQIDHVVALKNAYTTGAHRWDFAHRCLYANFLGNDFHLLPVDGRENMRKGDRTPADWMPMDRRAHCTHLLNWLKVKSIWGLVLGPREAAAIGAFVRAAGCDARAFRLPASVIAQQRDFIRRNLDLCSHVVPGGDDFDGPAKAGPSLR